MKAKNLKLFLLIIVMSCIYYVSKGQQTKDLLIGTWKQSGVKADESGLTVKYQPDSTCTYWAWGLTVNPIKITTGKWKLSDDGKQIISTTAMHKIPDIISLSADELIVSEIIDGEKTTFTYISVK